MSLRLEAARVLDLREGAVRKRLGLSLRTIRQTDWRQDNQRRQEALTQAWGAAFEAAGFEAVIVPSSTGQGGRQRAGSPRQLPARQPVRSGQRGAMEINKNLQICRFWLCVRGLGIKGLKVVAALYPPANKEKRPPGNKAK